MTLPLTVTRRCGKRIVEEARAIVADFEAHEANPEGVVRQDVIGEDAGSGYAKDCGDGDFIVCRVNAPLVGQCFRFLRAGRKATIQGRDIGAGLVSTVKKMKARDVADLTAKLSDWLAEETRKEQAKRNPSEQRLISLQDRYDCLVCFTEGCATVEDVIRKIESVFTDRKDERGIRLSSIHKAKGLEAERVFFLCGKGMECPHPMARSEWQVGQEWNLRYVAVTRAIRELVYVSPAEGRGGKDGKEGKR